MEQYKLIIVPFIALIVCQIIKVSIESIKNKKIMLDRLFNGAGGMPSTHATFTISLLTLLVIECGIDSPIFAVALIFTLIVLYDAIGVRYESGLQAKMINNIINKLESDKHLVLKEKIGHKPLEVFCGALLGFLVSIIYILVF